MSEPLSLIVRFMNGPADGRWVTLQGETITIGHAPESDVVIDFDPSVADTHLEMKSHAGQWMMLDRSASQGGGIFADGQPVPDRTLLTSGTLVTLGNTQLLLSTNGQHEE